MPFMSHWKGWEGEVGGVSLCFDLSLPSTPSLPISSLTPSLLSPCFCLGIALKLGLWKVTKQGEGLGGQEERREAGEGKPWVPSLQPHIQASL